MKSALQRAAFLGLFSAASAVFALPVEPPGVLSAPEVLSLGEAVDMALDQNPSMHASRAALNASEWASRKSYLAFLPTGSFSSSVTRVDDNTYNRANQAVSGMEQMFEALGITGVEIEPFLYHDTYRTSFTVNQQFPLNLNLIGQRGLASAGLRAGEAGLAASRSEITLAVRRAFFSVLATREMNAVAQESVTSAENRMALARDKAELGMLPRSDVLRWETTLAEAKSGELAASNGMRLAEMNLNRLLGRALNAPLSLERVSEAKLGHALSLSEIDPETLAEGILNHSPTARAIQAGADAASAGKTLAMSGITPSLHFSLNKGWQDNDTMELDGDTTSAMTALVTMPVFDLMGNYAAYKQASAEKRRAKYESAAALEQLRMGAWAAWLEVERSRQNLSFRESAERQARETFNEMESRYEAGQVAEFDLVDVQVGLTAARAQAVASRYEYFGALAALESLVGEPMTMEEMK